MTPLNSFRGGNGTIGHSSQIAYGNNFTPVPAACSKCLSVFPNCDRAGSIVWPVITSKRFFLIMNELDLCHWLLLEPTGNCRNVIAPGGDSFEDYIRVGPVASSPQFVLPMVFAVTKINKNPKSHVSALVDIDICLHRDDKDNSGPAFGDMPDLKIVGLISEFSCCIAQWVRAIGGCFVSIQLKGTENTVIRISFCVEEFCNRYYVERALTLCRAGIEMMAYARGLKIASWELDK